MLKQNDAGKEVVKRRVVVTTRVEKERTGEYLEKKERALSARDKRIEPVVAEKKAKDVRVYRNMFSNFAENYSKTLERIIKQSKEHSLR